MLRQPAAIRLVVKQKRINYTSHSPSTYISVEAAVGVEHALSLIHI